MDHQDVLYVRVYPKDRDQGERLVIDFGTDAHSDHFMLLGAEGGTINLGAERLKLSWKALEQLSELIREASRTLTKGE